MSACYVCTKDTSLKHGSIPMCSECQPRAPKIRAPKTALVPTPRITAPSPASYRYVAACSGIQLNPTGAKWCGKHGPLGANQFPSACVPLCELHTCSENVCYCH